MILEEPDPKEAGDEAAILEFVDQLPIIGSFFAIGHARRRAIEEAQFRRRQVRFFNLLWERVRFIQDSEGWLKTPAGEKFAFRVYTLGCDIHQEQKQDFVANAFANGARLGSDEAKRDLFLDMLARATCADLQVLASSIPTKAHALRVITVGSIAMKLGWGTDQAAACLTRLVSAGVLALQDQLKLADATGQLPTTLNEFLATDLTIAFAEFVSDPENLTPRDPESPA